MPAGQFERVAGLLRKATLSLDDTEKLNNLQQVKELITNYDSSLLDNFFEEVVAFQHYPNLAIKKFIVKFIEDACLVDAGLLLKSIGCLSHLFNLSLHQEPPLSSLLRSVILTMGPLYRRALTRAVKVGFIESGALGGSGIEAGSAADNAFEHFRSMAALKDEIIRLLLPGSVGVMQGTTLVPPPPAVLTRLCALISDGAKTSIIKLVETVIIAQSRRTSASLLPAKAETDISLDQIPDMPNSLLKSIVESSTAASSSSPLPGICLIRPRRLADEAERLLTGLTSLPLRKSDEASVRFVVTGAVFDAIMDSLVNIAGQRPQFLDKAVQTFETVHVNLPTHFSQVQVASARQKVKSGLLALLQHPSTASEYQSRITILLTDLGATQSEVIGAMRRSSTRSPTFPLGEKAVDVDMRTSTTSAASVTTTTLTALPPSDPRRRHSSSSSSADPTAMPGRSDDMKRKSEPPETTEKAEAATSSLQFGEDDDEDDEDDELPHSRKRIRLELPPTKPLAPPSDPRISARRAQQTGGMASVPSGPPAPPLLPIPSATATATSTTKKALKTGAIPDIDEITNGLIPKLTSANVADLVLLSMVMLPDRMPAAFNATYTPIAAAGTNPQIRHLARLLAAQLGVWVSGEEDAKVREDNRVLLMKLFESPETVGSAAGTPGTATGDEEKTATSAVAGSGAGKKGSSGRTRKPKVDEDDEAAFMKAHAARVHGFTKPMNITVLHSGGTGVTSPLVPPLGAGPLSVPPSLLVPPPPLFDPTVPPPQTPTNLPAVAAAVGAPKPVVPLPGTVAIPARPFSLDSAVMPLSRDAQRSLAREAFVRILSAVDNEGSMSRKTATASLPLDASIAKAPSALSSDLPADFDTVRIKLICRLPNKRFSASDLYPILINYAMQNLKEGYELLASLLMHEYTSYRGFKLQSFHHGDESRTIHLAGCPKKPSTSSGDQRKSSTASVGPPSAGATGKDEEEDDEDFADSLLLEQSKQQLRALAKLKQETSEAGDESGRMYDEDVLFGVGSQVQEGGEYGTDPLEAEEEEEDVFHLHPRRSSLLGPGLSEELGSLSFYDALLTEILTRLSAPEIKETYFGRLLLEAPVLTQTAINSLKRYCWNPEHAPYGFQTLRSLIECRPTEQRKELFDLLLNFASVDDTKIRRAALTAVTELAQSNAKWQDQIETYAIDRLKKLLLPAPAPELFPFTVGAVMPTEWTDESCQTCAHLLLGLMPRNPRRLLLTLAEVYVEASVTAKRTLLRMMDASVFEIGLHSPDLLTLVDECPMGAESLVTRMLSILTDPRTVFSRLQQQQQQLTSSPASAGTAAVITPGSTTATTAVAVACQNVIPIMPPPALVDRVRRLYATRVHDVRCLIPVLVGLTKQEVIAALPKLVQLNEKVVKEVISRLLHASVATIPAPNPRLGLENVAPTDTVLGPLTPEELLVAIHLLEFAKDPGAPPSSTASSETVSPAKPLVDIRIILRACLYCFSERRLFTQERLSAAIGQLLDQPVLPTLFLRTVMQALALYPRLAGYVINVLFRLIRKQVWKSAALWDGFIRCCIKTRPQSYQVLLQLPPQQLQSVFTKEPHLRAQVRRYVENFSSAQRMHISRAVVEVLEREPSPVGIGSKPTTKATAAGEQITTTAASEVLPRTASDDPVSTASTLEGENRTRDEDKEVVGKPERKVEQKTGSRELEPSQSPVRSSGSVTPTRDEEPVHESVAVIEAKRLSQLTSDANFQLSFESSFTDEGSLSPPRIVSRTTYAAVSRAPDVAATDTSDRGDAAIADSDGGTADHCEESYSPPPLPNNPRRISHDVAAARDAQDSGSNSATETNDLTSQQQSRPAGRTSTKRQVDDDKLEADKRRLEEAFKSRQAGWKQRKQNN
uniref:Symplekin n=1 Tax=Schistocephalus solidus TaxID=70667 RepID=A0A0X3NLC9_SCHSO